MGHEITLVALHKPCFDIQFDGKKQSCLHDIAVSSDLLTSARMVLCTQHGRFACTLVGHNCVTVQHTILTVLITQLV